MKTILIPISNSFFIRNFMRTSALPALLGDERIRLVLLAPKDKLAYYASEFRHPRIIFDELPDMQKLRQEKIFKIIEYASIHTRTVTMLHWWDLKRVSRPWKNPRRVFLFAVRRFMWWLGQFGWWRALVRRAYYAIPSSMCTHLFDRHRPDLIYCSAIAYSEVICLKEAKKRGIPTVGMVLSWDNFYSKLFMRVHPDYLLVHTPGIADQAVRFGDYPPDRIKVIGIPQFDRSINKIGFKPREMFLRELGGDPSKKLIVYAFSGKAGLLMDFDMLDILHKAIKNGEIKDNVQVLARPYPRYDFPPEKLEKIKKEYGFLAEPAMAHIGTRKENWEFDERSLVLLTNTLAHADIIVTMYSTFFIEGAFMDKPLIAVAFDGYRDFDYYNSARRFFDWDHLAQIKPSGGIEFASSKEELIAAVNTYLADPGYRKDGRQTIVAEQCHFTDGKSGERVAQALLNMIWP